MRPFPIHRLGLLAALVLGAGSARGQTPGVTFFGTASPGCVGVGVIGVNSAPSIGNAGFQITCTNAFPSTTGTLLISTGRLTLPVLIGGAAIWPDPARGLFIPVGWSLGGSATIPLAIPPDPMLIGFILYCQFGWADPGPTCVGLAVAATQAMQLQIQPLTCNNDPYETNNTCAQARAIAVNGSVQPLLCPSGEEDWFQVTVPARGAWVAISMTPPAGKDYDLEVWGPCTTRLAQSVQRGAVAESVGRCAAAGTVLYIRVLGFAGAFDAAAPYTLSVTATPPPPSTTVTSGPVSTGTGVRWHPNLITTLSVPTAPGPCTETWNITATGSWSASCGGSVEIDYYDTALPSPQTLAGTGANPYSLGGSLTGRIPGHAYTVGLVTNFLCNPSVGGTLTINRSIP